MPFFPLLIFSLADLNLQLKILVVLQNIFLPLAQSVVHVHHITLNCQVVLDTKLEATHQVLKFPIAQAVFSLPDC